MSEEPRVRAKVESATRSIPPEALTTLLTVSSALASTLELDEVLQVAIESAAKVMGLETGAIYVLEEGELYLGATTPPLPQDFPDQLRIAPLTDHPHIGRALDSAAPVFVDDFSAEESTPAEREAVEQRGLQSLLFVPLIVDEERLGVFIVGSKGHLHDFCAGDVDLCVVLAHQISLAVANARLYRSLVRSNAEIRDLNDNLEQLIMKRTEQLDEANQELEAQNEELICQSLELEERSQELAEANAAKTRFLRSMSHELRTPLNSVIGFSDIILRGLTGEITDEQRRQLEIINSSGTHLLALINDILDMSRIEAGVMKLEFVEVDVESLVTETVDSISAAAAEKGLGIEVDLEQPAPRLVSDPVRVRQILLNLLGNAIKFTQDGGVTLRIVSPGTHIVSFAVQDTGPGILPEHRRAIFGEFERGVIAHDAVIEGAGLGLAISQRLAAALGGAITLESAPGQGSTFTLSLPEAPEIPEAP